MNETATLPNVDADSLPVVAAESPEALEAAQADAYFATLDRIDHDLARLEELAAQLADGPEAPAPAAFEAPPGFLLSVVIPVYNEERTILRVIKRVSDVPLPKEIIVVDDCSFDGTAALLQTLAHRPDIRVLRQDRNQGKGAALRRGFAAAKGDVVVIQDADLEYSPRDIPRLVQPLIAGRADVVYGSRYRQGAPLDTSWLHRFGNRLLTRASNLFTGLRLTDMETCYKAFRREALQGLTLEQDRFGFEPEITAKIARRKLKVLEVPVRYFPRSYAEGKKIGLRDAWEALYCIVRYSRGKQAC